MLVNEEDGPFCAISTDHQSPRQADEAGIMATDLDKIRESLNDVAKAGDHRSIALIAGYVRGHIESFRVGKGEDMQGGKMGRSQAADEKKQARVEVDQWAERCGRWDMMSSRARMANLANKLYHFERAHCGPREALCVSNNCLATNGKHQRDNEEDLFYERGDVWVVRSYQDDAIREHRTRWQKEYERSLEVKAAVFGTTELLEHSLSFLPPRDLLIATRTNKAVLDCYKGSKKLQNKTYERPRTTFPELPMLPEGAPMDLNPELVDKHDADRLFSLDGFRKPVYLKLVPGLRVTVDVTRFSLRAMTIRFFALGGAAARWKRARHQSWTRQYLSEPAIPFALEARHSVYGVETIDDDGTPRRRTFWLKASIWLKPCPIAVIVDAGYTLRKALHTYKYHGQDGHWLGNVRLRAREPMAKSSSGYQLPKDFDYGFVAKVDWPSEEIRGYLLHNKVYLDPRDVSVYIEQR